LEAQGAPANARVFQSVRDPFQFRPVVWIGAARKIYRRTGNLRAVQLLLEHGPISRNRGRRRACASRNEL